MGICTSCGRGTLEPKITSKPFLVIKEMVTEAEIDAEAVFIEGSVNKWGYKENTASYYLAKEMAMAGIQMNTLCLTNLYMHVPSKGKKSKEAKELAQGCLDYSISQVVKLAEGKKIIFMMGAGVIREFTGYPASDVYGLICQSDLLPNVPLIIPAPNSDKLMSMPVGELRNSLKVFKEQIDIYNKKEK